jgi:hypothetical protein
MTLFTPDLFRKFALGFVAGALLVGAANFDEWSDQVSPPANAAAGPVEAPPASDDFWKMSE